MKNSSSIYVRVSPAFKNKIRSFCQYQNMTESELIRNAINFYFNNSELRNLYYED